MELLLNMLENMFMMNLDGVWYSLLCTFHARFHPTAEKKDKFL